MVGIVTYFHFQARFMNVSKSAWQFLLLSLPICTEHRAENLARKNGENG